MGQKFCVASFNNSPQFLHFKNTLRQLCMKVILKVKDFVVPLAPKWRFVIKSRIRKKLSLCLALAKISRAVELLAGKRWHPSMNLSLCVKSWTW